MVTSVKKHDTLYYDIILVLNVIVPGIIKTLRKTWEITTHLKDNLEEFYRK